MTSNNTARGLKKAIYGGLFSLLTIFVLLGYFNLTAREISVRRSVSPPEARPARTLSVRQSDNRFAANENLVSAWSTSSSIETRPAYMRVERDDDGKPLALQTSIVRFVPTHRRTQGLTVDLIGAVHVGDQAYYETLNRRFQDYDVVLYELIAPEGTRIPKGGSEGGGGMIGGIQNGMKSMLDLTHQLNHIDYTAMNLVHADMSPGEFSQAMEDRGESWLQMYFRELGYSMATQAGKDNSGDFSMLRALFSRDRTRQMKILLADQFEQQEGMVGALEGPEGSAIITGRNGKCFEILQEQIRHGNKRIAVFYGAGHLYDMELRLESDFGLQRSRECWVDAWNLEAKN